eukprot:490933-Rhodomonas_salina.1
MSEKLQRVLHPNNSTPQYGARLSSLPESTDEKLSTSGTNFSEWWLLCQTGATGEFRSTFAVQTRPATLIRSSEETNSVDLKSFSLMKHRVNCFLEILGVEFFSLLLNTLSTILKSQLHSVPGVGIPMHRCYKISGMPGRNRQSQPILGFSIQMQRNCWKS